MHRTYLVINSTSKQLKNLHSKKIQKDLQDTKGFLLGFKDPSGDCYLITSIYNVHEDACRTSGIRSK